MIHLTWSIYRVCFQRQSYGPLVIVIGYGFLNMIRATFTIRFRIRLILVKGKVMSQIDRYYDRGL